MTDIVDEESVDLPHGLFYHEVMGLYAEGIVARDVENHIVNPRPTKPLGSCTLDKLGGNTMMSVHLAQVNKGGTKCNHRHLDETCAFMVSGSGWTEMRQSDNLGPIRVDWRSGDMVVIPTNAWHRHTNASTTEYARQLSFRNSTFMKSILHGGRGMYEPNDSMYNGAGRFLQRFDDEADYFDVWEQVAPNVVRANLVRQIADQPVPEPDPQFGEGVSVMHYVMGGQRTLDVTVTAIREGGATRAYAPQAEEVFLVLKGSGETETWDGDGPHHRIPWTRGDVVAIPFGASRRHSAASADEVRLLRVRCVAFQRALGETSFDDLDTPTPDRFGQLVNDGYLA
jgi:quercetin dioxygenase-like cupin family protein